MRILAIDTSGPACSAALSENGKLLYEIVMNSERTHSETLMPAIDEIFERARLSPGDIDLFAAIAGPGSFTGVRIGVCAARALSHATGKPCARVNALEALAAGAYGARGVVCPILDARREQVYCAAFRYSGNGAPERALPDAALPLSDFLSMLPKDEPLLFTGDGVAVHEARIVSELGDRAMIAPLHARVMRASFACALAELSRIAGGAPEALTPIYLRAPQAERERSERLTRAKL